MLDQGPTPPAWAFSCAEGNMVGWPVGLRKHMGLGS